MDDYVWVVNQQGELELRNETGKLIVSTGVEIGNAILSNSGEYESLTRALLILCSSNGTSAEEYAKSKEGFEAIQRCATAFLSSRHL